MLPIHFGPWQTEPRCCSFRAIVHHHGPRPKRIQPLRHLVRREVGDAAGRVGHDVAGAAPQGLSQGHRREQRQCAVEDRPATHHASPCAKTTSALAIASGRPGTSTCQAHFTTTRITHGASVAHRSSREEGGAATYPAPPQRRAGRTTLPRAARPCPSLPRSRPDGPRSTAGCQPDSQTEASCPGAI